MILGVFMKKSFVFFVLLALLTSCSTTLSRYIGVSGLSFTEGMENDVWRLRILYEASVYEDTVFEEKIDVLAVDPRGSIIARINLTQEGYRYLLSMMLYDGEDIRFEIVSAETSFYGISIGFLGDSVAESVISSLNQS